MSPSLRQACVVCGREFSVGGNEREMESRYGLGRRRECSPACLERIGPDRDLLDHLWARLAVGAAQPMVDL